jgi:hypothetical protein
MAVNDTRNLTEELILGAGDGSYKDLAPDRGGEVESAPLLHRQSELAGDFYGLKPGIPVERSDSAEPHLNL